MSFLQQLEHADQWLFLKINGASNAVFDVVMPFAREPLDWAPLYFFLLLLALFNFKGKGAWWCLFFIATAALTDLTGTYVFKHNFHRMRPCFDPSFSMHVRVLVDRCSGGSSFISNHAANHFGLATFFYTTMKPVLNNKWRALAFAWAGLVAYAQIYVGLHYPLDILAGSLLGLLAGAFTGWLFNKRYGFAIFDNQPTLS